MLEKLERRKGIDWQACLERRGDEACVGLVILNFRYQLTGRMGE